MGCLPSDNVLGYISVASKYRQIRIYAIAFPRNAKIRQKTMPNVFDPYCCRPAHSSSSTTSEYGISVFNILRPRQNGRHFPDNTFKRIYLNENVRLSIKISLKFVPKGPMNKIPALVQIMAWRRPGAYMHICVTRPQWVNLLPTIDAFIYELVECALGL